MTLKVLEPNQTDLELQQFATLSAIKGTQFDRDVYSSVIKFKDLDKFLQTFPNVQRNINRKKVASLKKYILSGLENNTLNMRFFSAVTVTCRGTIFYDDVNKRMAINTNEVKLSINDGQHRFAAINDTLDYLENEFVKSKDKIKTEVIHEKINILKDMIVPVVIFDGLSEMEEKQLFHDLNNLAQRPSRNVNIRLNQTDMYSRLARELSEENRYLDFYGIEMDKLSIQEGNHNTFTLATVYESIKEILGYKQNTEALSEFNFEKCKKIVNETFDRLFFILPPDLNVKGKYLLDKSYALRSICRFIADTQNSLDLMIEEDKVFDIIADIDWTMNLDFWSKYGGSAGKDGNIVFPGGGYGAAKAVYQAMISQVEK